MTNTAKKKDSNPMPAAETATASAESIQLNVKVAQAFVDRVERLRPLVDSPREMTSGMAATRADVLRMALAIGIKSLERSAAAAAESAAEEAEALKAARKRGSK